MRWTTIRTLELLARDDRTTTELALDQLCNRQWIEWVVAELAAESLVVTDPPVASAPDTDERTVGLADGDVVDRYRRVAERFDLRRVLSPYRERLVRVLATGPAWPGLLPAFNRPYMRRDSLATLADRGVVERSGDRVRLADDDVRAFLDATAFRWASEPGRETTGDPTVDDGTVLRARDVHAQLRRIDAGLDEPATAYLMGGGVLALDGIRDGTHDVDLVVPDDQETAQRVARAFPGEARMTMVGLGHHCLFQPAYGGSYYPPFALRGDDGADVQVFWGWVANTVALTDSMRERARPLRGSAGVGEFDRLDVGTLSATDLVFTLATKRGEEGVYDVERLLARRSDAVDWDALLAELSTQSARSGIALAPVVADRCRRLARRSDVAVPVQDALERLAAQQAVPVRLAEPCRRATLAADLPFDDDVLSTALDRLLASGVVERTRDGRLLAAGE